MERKVDEAFVNPVQLEPKVEMTVQPSRKKRTTETKDISDALDNPDKPRAFLTVAKKKRATKDEYYVDPKEFAARIKEYYETEDDKGENYQKLGKIFLDIARRLTTAASFARYSYKEEFIGEALIKMVKALRGKKYSFEFGSSPFSYYSQICYWAFCAVIKNEQKQAEIAKKYREVKYIESFKENEYTQNVYVRPEQDGEIFKDYSYYVNNSDTNIDD